MMSDFTGILLVLALLAIFFTKAQHVKFNAPDLQDAIIYKLTGYKGWE